MLDTKGARHVSRYREHHEGHKERNKKGGGSGENTRIISVIGKEHGGRSRTRINDLVGSCVSVAMCWCHVLSVLGQTERTRPALLREADPYGCLDQARSGKLYHICTGF